MLSQQTVSDAIARITTEVSRYQWNNGVFEKFTDSPYDRDVRGYFEGQGGYYLKFLPLLIAELKLANILELGNYAGASTVAMYAGMPAHSSMTTVDVVQDQRYFTNAMRADPRVHSVIGDVLDLSIYGAEPPMDIDFLFEDTHHFYRHMRDIFDIYEPLLRDRALIAIDDINDNDKRKFFDEVPYPKWDLTELCHHGGWGLILYERKEALDPQSRLSRAYRTAMQVWRRRHDAREAELEERRPRTLRRAVQDLIHRHRQIHAPILWLKRSLGMIPKTVKDFDEQRFYSAGRIEEERRVRHHIKEMNKGE